MAMLEPPRAQKKLLILDNDQGIVELAAWFLERKGYRVRTASSFRDARAALTREWPDLLLSDLDLGAENGAEELPRMSAAGCLPPTLVVSGYLDSELAQRLCALPEVLGTIVKPFDLPILEERIEACLASRDDATARKPAGRLPPLGETAIVEDVHGWIEIKPFDPSSGQSTRLA
jgi:DNA-binding NtrC family response regulator